MRLFLKIMQADNQYTAAVYKAGSELLPHTIPGFDLTPETCINIKGEDFTMRGLTEAFNLYQPGNKDRYTDIMESVLDDAGQLFLGKFLYERTFGRLETQTQKILFGDEEQKKEIRIMTDDPVLLSLPWILLYRNRSFLFLSHCAIALSHPFADETKEINVRLPALTRLLFACPDPFGDTEWENHFQKFRENLAVYDSQLCTPENLQTATTWSEFRDKLERFKPHIIYYYGHAVGGMYNVKLQFAREEGGDGTNPVSVLDLAAVLKRSEWQPAVAYFNCCRGNSAGLAGIGMQLEGMIPAVITNRTTAFIDAAQEQALIFWEHLLAGNCCPCKALLEVYSRIGDKFTTQESKWFTPVLHANYSDWNKEHLKYRRKDQDHYLKLARKESYTVVDSSTKMIRELKPRTYAFAWYGQPGQGLELFHRRLELELSHIQEKYHYMAVTPELPKEMNQLDDESLNPLFREMMTSAFRLVIKTKKCRDFQDITYAIRYETHGAAAEPILVFIQHHIPLMLENIFKPAAIKRYLKWLNYHFIPMLEPSQLILLGISFETKKPDEFKTSAKAQAGLAPPRPFPLISLRLLEPLENITEEDIAVFLDDNYNNLSAEEQTRIISRVMEKSGGSYEMAVNQLQDELENYTLNKPEGES